MLWPSLSGGTCWSGGEEDLGSVSSLDLPSLQHLHPSAGTKERTNPGTEMLLVPHTFCWVTQAGHCLMPWFPAAKHPLVPSSPGLGGPGLTESPQSTSPVKDPAPSSVGTLLKPFAVRERPQCPGPVPPRAWVHPHESPAQAGGPGVTGLEGAGDAGSNLHVVELLGEVLQPQQGGLGRPTRTDGGGCSSAHTHTKPLPDAAAPPQLPHTDLQPTKPSKEGHWGH